MDDYSAARSRIIPPLPWPTFSPPFSDRHGYPTRLFTTNRWVTAETWYPAADLVRMLDRFAIDHAHPSWPTNRWLTAMLRLFRPEIAALIEARDRVFAAPAERFPDRDPWEDRELETLTEIAIDVSSQRARVMEARGRSVHGATEPS